MANYGYVDMLEYVKDYKTLTKNLETIGLEDGQKRLTFVTKTSAEAKKYYEKIQDDFKASSITLKEDKQKTVHINGYHSVRFICAERGNYGLAKKDIGGKVFKLFK